MKPGIQNLHFRNCAMYFSNLCSALPITHQMFFVRLCILIASPKKILQHNLSNQQEK